MTMDAQTLRRAETQLAKLIPLCFLLLALLLGGPTHAQEEEPLRLTVYPTLQGRYVPGQATMLRVLLENEGPDLEGEVQVQAHMLDAEGLYVVPLSLPRHSRKEVPVVVGPLSRMSSAHLQVRFVAAEKVQIETSVQLTALSSNAFVVGQLVPDPAPLAFLSGVKPETVMLSLNQADLPEQVWPLYNLDLLILSGVDTSTLSSGQRQALAQWVGAGGHLVVTGGPNAARTAAGLPEGLLPVTLEGETTLETLPSLESWVGEEIPPAGPYLVSRATALTGIILLEEQDLDLIVTRLYGLGRVTFLALDPTLAPLRSWAGNEPLWNILLRSDPRPPPWRRPLIQEPMLLTAMLSEAANLRLPSGFAVGALLLLYIVLVGPVNYLVLRRKGRLEWAWVTIPLLTLLFAVGVYALGYTTRGGTRSLTTISIVRMAAGGPVALVDSYGGVFSPRRQEYTVSAGPEALFGSLIESTGYPPSGVGARPLEVVQQEETVLRNFRVEQWSMRTFASQTVLDPAPDFRAEVQRNGSRVSGTFSNQTGNDLKDCTIFSQGRYASLGDLAAGQSTSRTITLYSYSSTGPYYPPYGPSADPIEQILSAIFGYSSLAIAPSAPGMICWTEEYLPILELPEALAKKNGRTFYLIALDVEGLTPAPAPQQSPPFPPTIPPPAPIAEELSSWEVISTNVRLPTCTGGLLPGEWKAVLEYQLPSTITSDQVRGFDLRLAGLDWDPLPEVAFYSWRQGWAPMATSSSGTVSISEIEVPLFLQPSTGIIWLQLTSQSQSGSCLYPILEMWRTP